MNYLKWLKLTITITILFLLLVVTFNFCIDTYGARLSLFSVNKEVGQIKTFTEINQHIFNPEYIFRHPDRFDSFIFGSSRTAVINPEKICDRKFYNMSYTQGLPSEHLAILKTFVRKGIKIKTVIIGVDEFCFTLSPREHEEQLLRMMHPSVTGRNLHKIFFTFFFRMPKLFEISNSMKLLLNDEQKKKFLLNEKGLQLLWVKKEKKIELSGKPIFTTEDISLSPKLFNEKSENEFFAQIREIISLSKENNFTLIIFFNPLNNNPYIKYANSLFPVKRKLASMIDFYDFSGLNSVTLNNLNYYEEHHYRYMVGDMIVKRIFGYGTVNVPDDFGVWVTRGNIARHLEKQKLELEQYLKAHNLQ
jgi:hypothetical protein